MKRGIIIGLVVLAVGIGSTGCRKVPFSRENAKSANDIPSNSLDGYAKAHGISREEAAKRLRANLVPSDSGPVSPQSASTSTSTSTQPSKP